MDPKWETIQINNKQGKLKMTYYIIAGIFIAGVIISLISGRRARSASPVLVLQKFKVDDSASDGIFIEMEGRASGLTALIFTGMGLSPKTTLRVTGTEWHKEQVSLSGQFHEVVPLSHVSVTKGGYSKPLLVLFIGVVIAVCTLLYSLISLLSQNFDANTALAYIVVGLTVGVACFLFYWFRKILKISIRAGGETSEILFQRGVAENVPIDLDKTLEAVGLLHRKVIEARNRESKRNDI